jgi:hypothetical protein
MILLYPFLQEDVKEEYENEYEGGLLVIRL